MYPEELSLFRYSILLVSSNDALRWSTFSASKRLKILNVCSSLEALQDLMLCLAAARQDLSFENVVLTNGSWEPSLATLSQRATSLASLQLSLLSVGESRVGGNLESVDWVSDHRSFHFCLVPLTKSQFRHFSDFCSLPVTANDILVIPEMFSKK